MFKKVIGNLCCNMVVLGSTLVCREGSNSTARNRPRAPPSMTSSQRWVPLSRQKLCTMLWTRSRVNTRVKSPALFTRVIARARVYNIEHWRFLRNRCNRLESTNFNWNFYASNLYRWIIVGVVIYRNYRKLPISTLLMIGIIGNYRNYQQSYDEIFMQLSFLINYGP